MTYQPVFPAALQPTAQALLDLLSLGELSPPSPGFNVRVNGEPLSAPARTYHSARRLEATIARSGGDARTLALCLGTTNWNGHVREECVRQLLMDLDRAWAVPFVVQLVGEYVIEIVDVIESALPLVNSRHFGEFVRENSAFMATTRHRVTSYWDCYFRQRFPALRDYPGFVALEAIERMA